MPRNIPNIVNCKVGVFFPRQLGNIGVISVRYQLSLCWFLGSLYLRLHLAVSCLFD